MTDYRDLARTLIKKSERLVLVGYLDQGKVATWGYGHTGPEVKPGQAIEPALAEHDLDVDLATHDAHMLTLVTPAAFGKLREHEKAALLDFTFNTGGGPDGSDRKHPKWEIWDVVDRGDVAEVPAQLQRFIYVHVDGVKKTSAGLKNRRTAEIVMWNTGDVDTAAAAACAGGNQVCSAATRVLPTPPVTSAPKALSRVSVWLKGIGLGGTTITAGVAKVASDDTQSQLQKVHDTVVTNAGSLGHFGPALVSVLAAGLVCVAGAQFLVHLEQQAKAKV